MASWFDSIEDLGKQALSFVDGIADNVGAQLTEAQAEMEAERLKLAEECGTNGQVKLYNSSLPWETENEEYAILSNDAMEKILKLSVSEGNFTVPPRHLNALNASAPPVSDTFSMPTTPPKDGTPSKTAMFPLSGPAFNFESFIPIATKLLEIDSNLARMHAKLSPKMEEETFWHHYYYRVMYVRASVGLDGTQVKEGPFGSQKEDKVAIFQPHNTSPDAHTYRRPKKENDKDGSGGARHNKVGSNAATPGDEHEQGGVEMMNKEVVEEKEISEEEKERLRMLARKAEDAMLAAEVEAELLDDDLDIDDLDLDVDLEGLGDLDLNLDDLDNLGDLDLDLLGSDGEGEGEGENENAGKGEMEGGYVVVENDKGDKSDKSPEIDAEEDDLDELGV